MFCFPNVDFGKFCCVLSCCVFVKCSVFTFRATVVMCVFSYNNTQVMQNAHPLLITSSSSEVLRLMYKWRAVLPGTVRGGLMPFQRYTWFCHQRQQQRQSHLETKGRGTVKHWVSSPSPSVLKQPLWRERMKRKNLENIQHKDFCLPQQLLLFFPSFPSFSSFYCSYCFWEEVYLHVQENLPSFTLGCALIVLIMMLQRSEVQWAELSGVWQ